LFGVAAKELVPEEFQLLSVAGGEAAAEVGARNAHAQKQLFEWLEVSVPGGVAKADEAHAPQRGAREQRRHQRLCRRGAELGPVEVDALEQRRRQQQRRHHVAVQTLIVSHWPPRVHLPQRQRAQPRQLQAAGDGRRRRWRRNAQQVRLF